MEYKTDISDEELKDFSPEAKKELIESIDKYIDVMIKESKDMSYVNHSECEEITQHNVKCAVNDYRKSIMSYKKSRVKKIWDVVGCIVNIVVGLAVTRIFSSENVLEKIVCMIGIVVGVINSYSNIKGDR